MNPVLAEFGKLKRSMSWVVVLLLPLVMVLSGSLLPLLEGHHLEEGWHTLWLRSVVFYGLFPLAVGIAVLASLVWRAEHRGGNWNALMGGPTSSLRVVVAKSAVVAVLAALMQAVALVAVLVLGKAAFGLAGLLPSEYVAVSAVLTLACVPVAVLQSWLSMSLRSFAAPVAAAFLGSVLSALALSTELGAVVFVSPYALLSRVSQVGTATFADTGDITPAALVTPVLAAVFLTALLLALSTAVLERSDTRA